VGRHGDPHVSHLHDGSQPAGISDQYSGRPVHSADRHGVRKKIRGQIVSRAAIQGAVTRVVIAVFSPQRPARSRKSNRRRRTATRQPNSAYPRSQMRMRTDGIAETGHKSRDK
jgi:hypothetical protein